MGEFFGGIFMVIPILLQETEGFTISARATYTLLKIYLIEIAEGIPETAHLAVGQKAGF